jgi:Core-2/I-Branching enzyme
MCAQRTGVVKVAELRGRRVCWPAGCGRYREPHADVIEVEWQMKLAYLIRAHHRPAQLARLVRRLEHDDASFYIHVSGRTSQETHSAMRSALGDAPNVHWTRRVTTYYGGFSLVKATLVSIEEIAREDPLPDYTILLSGQDYPLKPPGEIASFLARHAGKSFVHHFPLPSHRDWPDEDGGLDRIRYWHFERVAYRTRQLRIPLVTRRFPRGFQPYGGSAWCSLTAECLRYVIDFVDQNESFVRFFKHVFIPDELFLQTIILNSPLRETVVNDVLHYIQWPGGAHPATLGAADLPKLTASGKLFARKFDVKHDSEILDLLDREILLSPDIGTR